jgi:propanol-preferring alcohol dehydrogenase
MRAMVLEEPGRPLAWREAVSDPIVGPGQVAIRVAASGVCRTDLHIVDGELPPQKTPLIPGHQIVGVVEEVGEGVDIAVGTRVGVPWLAWTCGVCPACVSGHENLCDRARFTGYHVDGGFAERCVADARYAFALPAGVDDVHAAPLLCAGLIGHRALRMAGDAGILGLYGFGAAAHLVAQIARFEGRTVFAFTRDGDERSQAFARSLGAAWAGGAGEVPPEPLDAAILFAPVGEHVPVALAAVRKGGTVVCAGIHMTDIPSFPYRLLWGERSVRSVTNLTRRDGVSLLELAGRVPLRPHVVEYRLDQANDALVDLRQGAFDGAAVLRVEHGEEDR